MPKLLQSASSLREALQFDTARILVFRQHPVAPPPLGETAVYYSENEARWIKAMPLAGGEVEIDDISVEEAVKWFRRHGQPLPLCLEPAFLFLRQGDRWYIQDGTRRGYVKHIKGMIYIAVLLRSPWQSVSASQLVRYAEDSPGDTQTLELAKEAADQPFQLPRRQESLDTEAANAYRRRMEELIEEINEAEAAKCMEEAEECRKEFDDIAKVVQRSLKRRNAKRMAGSQDKSQSLQEVVERTFLCSDKSRSLPESDGSDKSRNAVGNAIRRAISQIAACPQLKDTAAHLTTMLELGSSCVYFPDPRTPRWVVEL
jgi:hypothetical protein